MAWAPLNFWSGSGPDQAAILVAVLTPKPGADRSSLDTFMAKSEKLAIYQDRPEDPLEMERRGDEILRMCLKIISGISGGHSGAKPGTRGICSQRPERRSRENR
jgi:hypothetical protein